MINTKNRDLFAECFCFVEMLSYEWSLHLKIVAMIVGFTRISKGFFPSLSLTSWCTESLYKKETPGEFVQISWCADISSTVEQLTYCQIYHVKSKTCSSDTFSVILRVNLVDIHIFSMQVLHLDFSGAYKLNSSMLNGDIFCGFR